VTTAVRQDPLPPSPSRWHETSSLPNATSFPSSAKLLSGHTMSGQTPPSGLQVLPRVMPAIRLPQHPAIITVVQSASVPHSLSDSDMRPSSPVHDTPPPVASGSPPVPSARPPEPVPPVPCRPAPALGPPLPPAPPEPFEPASTAGPSLLDARVESRATPQARQSDTPEDAKSQCPFVTRIRRWRAHRVPLHFYRISRRRERARHKVGTGVPVAAASHWMFVVILPVVGFDSKSGFQR
jgi:hypothetical protein